AAPVVIHAASASPSAGEEENPDPLHPLATHRPGTPGTGPATKQPSGLIVNSPPRCSATGARTATGTSAPTCPAIASSTPRSSGTSSVLNESGCWRGSSGSGPASNPPSISPPRAGRRYTAASTTRAIGPAGSTSGTGAVMSSWWRTGATGTRPPASSATCRTQPPAASTTALTAIHLPDVSTPAPGPSVRDMPTAGSFSSTVAPCSRQASRYASTRLAGSSM